MIISEHFFSVGLIILDRIKIVPRIIRQISLSYPQRHDDVFVVVIGVAGDAHLGLGVAVLELERDARFAARLFDSDGFAVGFLLVTCFRCVGRSDDV
jgi:hypothetical protein